MLGYMNDEPMPRAWFQYFDDSVSCNAMKQLSDFIRFRRQDGHSAKSLFKTKLCDSKRTVRDFA